MALNLHGIVDVFNKAAAEILELNQEEVLNQPFALNFLNYAENDDFNQAILNFFLQQMPVNMFVIRYFTGREEKLLFMKCRLVYENNQGIPEKIGMMVVFRDVSQLAEMKKVLQTSELMENHNGDGMIEASLGKSTQRPLISLQNVSKNYATGEILIQALKETSVEIYAGELVVIHGPSGCGKSTLLNLIGGMEQPSGGKIVYNGVNLETAGDRLLTQYRRQEVGFVFQFYNLIPDLTAGENILLAAELVDDPLPLDEVLREVGLEDRADHFPSQLSGGEQQRISVARAIIKRPKILLCDEPTGALDGKSGKAVLELIEKLSRGGERTVVIVTHNTAISAIADRIFKMRNGQLVESYRNPYPIPSAQVEL